MKSFQLYKDIVISTKKLESQTPNPHRHGFFEIIYVLEGSGIHIINDNHFAFSKADVFLLTPDDVHTFQIADPTTFCIIDFTKSFFSKDVHKSGEKADVSDFFKRLEYIFHNHHNVKGNIITKKDRQVFEALLQQLLKEQQENQLFREIITQNIVFLLLHLMARNIQQNISTHVLQQDPKSKVHEITAFIQQHIYNKEAIKLEKLAANFHKTSDHLNRYFKQQTGSTIKEYISKYKMSLVQTRLKHSNLTISQIADELGFTDESHLNKVFKISFGMTVSQYRKAYNRL